MVAGRAGDTGPKLEVVADAGGLADQLVLLDDPRRQRGAGGEVQGGHDGAELPLR